MSATNLLLTHSEDTFVAPVFVGSAALRDAAGQMIENTVKAVRRNQTVDDDFMEKLESDVISLYRLDQLSETTSVSMGEKDLGPLPKTAVILLGTLAVVWIGIIAYVFIQMVKSGKKQDKHLIYKK